MQMVPLNQEIIAFYLRCYSPVWIFYANSALSLYKICPESRQNSFILYRAETDPEYTLKSVQIFYAELQLSKLLSVKIITPDRILTLTILQDRFLANAF